MKVRFVPQNAEFEIKPGETVLHVAQDHGIYIKSVCRGVPSCAECRVRVVEGEFNVLQPGAAELSLIGTAHFVDRRRLSCQLRCYGDITVDLSEQIEKEKKALARNSRSRAGADELAISRSAASESTADGEIGGAGAEGDGRGSGDGPGLGGGQEGLEAAGGTNAHGVGAAVERRPASDEFARPREGGQRAPGHDASAGELRPSGGDLLGPQAGGSGSGSGSGGREAVSAQRPDAPAQGEGGGRRRRRRGRRGGGPSGGGKNGRPV